ncbi:MAG: porin family protein [Bacteroidales bacterium]
MKYTHKYATRRNIAILAFSLILMCQNLNAQPGYRPLFRKVPYQSRNNQYSSVQNRQGYNSLYNTGGAQPFISMGIHFDPLISWFSADSYDTRNDGAIPGFIFGVSYNKYFAPNYSFSSGINIINAGGRLYSREATYFELKNYNREIFTVGPGESITYKINYLSIPLGLKLQTNQTGHGTFFADLGFDPKVVIRGRADIPSLNIKGGNAMPELKIFNLSYHIMAGMEYPLAGNNNIVVGIGFENNFFDTTRDNGDQPWDVVSQKSLSFRIGITF